MLPDGWFKTTLEDFVDIKHGFAFKSNYFSDNGRYILMTPGSFYESGGFRDQGEKTKFYTGDVPEGYILKKGDVVLAMTEQAEGLLGSAAYVPEDNIYLHNQRLGLLKIKNQKKVCAEYLFLIYNSPLARKQISEQSAGTKVKHTSPDKLKSVQALLPPLPEQTKIAQILSTWDKAIETTKSLLANSQQQKKALMQQLLTGKKRLKGFGGEWKSVRLKSLLIEGKERNKDNLITRVLSVTNHSGFVLPEEQFAKRVASDDVTNYKVVRKGEYGYNPSRINVGSFARLDEYDVGLLSPMYVIFSVNEKLLNSDYFLAWMQSNEARQRVIGSTQGSVRDSVGFDALCRFPFKLPPMDEQVKIASILNAVNEQIIIFEKQIEDMQQEKKALIQALLTGKKRVKI